jgi:hypothetical protein
MDMPPAIPFLCQIKLTVQKFRVSIDGKVAKMDVFEAIGKRRSIRKFKDESLSEKQIEQLLEAARLAPSGCNVQPWRFIIVNRGVQNLNCFSFMFYYGSL